MTTLEWEKVGGLYVWRELDLGFSYGSGKGSCWDAGDVVYIDDGAMGNGIFNSCCCCDCSGFRVFLVDLIGHPWEMGHVQQTSRY